MVNPVNDDCRTHLLAAVFCESCRITYVPRSDQANQCPQCGTAPAICEVTLTGVSCDEPVSIAGLSASHADEVDELLGQTLDVYYLESLLGTGAMGRVYLARHQGLERSCALKILPPRLVQGDEGYIARFSNEGKAAASLVHPNIITVHAIGSERGYHFLEMEFVAGQTLQRLIRAEGLQTPERATALAARIAEGIAFAHRNGVLHRDLKLDNVLLSYTGVPKIADFGLAKRVRLPAHVPDAHEVVGTPAYMAPELFVGEEATPASDVYALGVCYYVLLTGRYPFYSTALSSLIRQVQQEPVPNPRQFNPQISLEMAECLHQLLAKAPSNRPADAHHAEQLLSAVLGQTEDLHSLVTAAFQKHPEIQVTQEDRGYSVDMTFENGRSQRVWIEPSEHAAADRLVTITSLCALSDPHFYETALRLNSEIQHGAVALREIEGKMYFVMRNNYPRTTVDAEEIRRSVLDIAHRADAIERLLTGEDIF